jgi:hypothetical protein
MTLPERSGRKLQGALTRTGSAHLVRNAFTAAALAGAGVGAALLLAACGSGNAAGKISTAIGTRSVSVPAVTPPDPTVTETLPGQTISATVQETVTAPAVTVPAAVPTTTTAAADSDETPPWVWVVIAIAGIALIALIVLLVSRGGSSELPLAERRRLVSATVASWVGQGWAVESQTDDSAVLHRQGQRVVVSVDGNGRVTSGPVGAPPV